MGDLGAAVEEPGRDGQRLGLDEDLVDEVVEQQLPGLWRVHRGVREVLVDRFDGGLVLEVRCFDPLGLDRGAIENNEGAPAADPADHGVDKPCHDISGSCHDSETSALRETCDSAYWALGFSHATGQNGREPTCPYRVVKRSHDSISPGTTVKSGCGSAGTMREAILSASSG